MSQITNAQIKKIYVTAKELGIGNELLHTFIFNLTGQEHISALTKYEAIEVIDKLERRKGGNELKKRISNKITPEQIWKIKQLEKELGWDENPNRLKGFIKKYAKVDVLKWLTLNQASNVIEGMKKLVDKNKNSQSSCQKYNSK